MKIVYLAAGIGQLKYKDVVYQDKFVERDISGDMLEINLDPYDIIVATPPCNYYSRARGNRLSKYAEATKHLLPDILNILTLAEKPFIVENVRNQKMFNDHGLSKFQCNMYVFGRHTYWSNIDIDFSNIYQVENELNNKIVQSGVRKGKIGTFAPPSQRQGGINVYYVIEHFLNTVKEVTNNDR